MHVRSLGMLSAPATTSAKSHLPADARLLIIGASAVGKTSLSRALQRYARKAGIEQLSIAESHGPRVPDLEALGGGLEVVLIVWEAAQGTPLPAYVAKYTSQIRGHLPLRDSPREQRRARRSGDGDGEEGGAGSREGDGVRESAGTSGAVAGEAASPRTDAARRSGSPSGAAAAATAGRDGSGPHGARAPRVLVVCNKCDVMPCPMPQMRGLPSSQAFIALSAERGTNLAHLWGMLQPILCPDAKSRPTRPARSSAANAVPADDTSSSVGTPTTKRRW